jgi:hypothetical protein
MNTIFFLLSFVKFVKYFSVLSLLVQPSLGRIINQSPFLLKTGAMAGAIPGALPRIPFQGTAHMGTALQGGRQEIGHGFQPVYQ